MLLGQRPDFGWEVVEHEQALFGTDLLRNKLQLGSSRLGLPLLLDEDRGILDWLASMAGDEDGGDIIGNLDDVALVVFAPEPVMDFRHNDPEVLAHSFP